MATAYGHHETAALRNGLPRRFGEDIRSPLSHGIGGVQHLSVENFRHAARTPVPIAGVFITGLFHPSSGRMR